VSALRRNRVRRRFVDTVPQYRRLAQSVEHHLHTVGVNGSSPLAPTKLRKIQTPLRRKTEQRSCLRHWRSRLLVTLRIAPDCASREPGPPGCAGTSRSTGSRCDRQTVDHLSEFSSRTLGAVAIESDVLQVAIQSTRFSGNRNALFHEQNDWTFWVLSEGVCLFLNNPGTGCPTHSFHGITASHERNEYIRRRDPMANFVADTTRLGYLASDHGTSRRRKGSFHQFDEGAIAKRETVTEEDDSSPPRGHVNPSTPGRPGNPPVRRRSNERSGR
jgi:hypothetical protein